MAQIDTLPYAVDDSDEVQLVKSHENGFVDPDRCSLSSSKFYNAKKLALGLELGSDVEDGLKLEEAGEMIANGRIEKGFRKGIENFPQYRKSLELIADRKNIDSEIDSEEAGFVLQGQVEKEYQERRLRRSASTMFSIFEAAGLGSVVSGSSRFKTFRLDRAEIRKFLGTEEDEESERKGLRDLISDVSKVFIDLEEDSMRFEISIDPEDVGPRIKELKRYNIEYEFK